MKKALTLYYRELTREDIPAINEMCKKIWDGEDYMPNIIDLWLNDPKSNNFGAFLDPEKTELVGTGRIKWLSDSLVWIQGGRVAFEYQKQGIGFSVSKYALDYAETHGAKFAQYDTWTENHGSCKLAEAHGFYRKDYLDTMFAKKEELIFLPSSNKFGPSIPISATEAYEFLKTIENGPKDEINMGWSYVPFTLAQLNKNSSSYIWKRNTNSLIQIHRMISSSSSNESPQYEYWYIMYGDPEGARSLLIAEINEKQEDQSVKSAEIFFPPKLRSSMQNLGFHWVDFPHPSGIVLFEKKLDAK
ncbi:GNAT family N-acetyltransferase [Candidatus Lokiarchaeum ossiferum]|uniref:GNAT family N-acetyltransferase n=1 Tax=Candidatus Lokiarchaeum ossiferum TaxID=2951803 RepID=UPI00352D57E9